MNDMRIFFVIRLLALADMERNTLFKRAGCSIYYQTKLQNSYRTSQTAIAADLELLTQEQGNPLQHCFKKLSDFCLINSAK